MRFLLLLALLASCSAIPITIPQSGDAHGITSADGLNPDGPPDAGAARPDGISGSSPDAAADAEADATLDDATLDDATPDTEAGS